MILATIISLEARGTHAKETFIRNTPVENTHVKDLGVYGEVFPIQERSLLEVIKAKLQALSESGKLTNHQQAIVNKTRERLSRPEPVSGIRKTIMPRSFTYDPSITVPYDLTDHQGRVFHKKGTKVNPLDTHALSCPLLFVDGDDEAQVAWAIHQFRAAKVDCKPKIILVKGAPFEISKSFALPVYFDQSGVLVKKLGITQVPAKVSQKDKLFLVEEFKPTGDAEGETSTDHFSQPISLGTTGQVK